MAGDDDPGAWVESWLSRPRFDKVLATMQTPTAKVGVAAAFDATPEELGAAAVKAARRGRIVEHIAHASSHVDVDVLLSDEAWR